MKLSQVDVNTKRDTQSITGIAYQPWSVLDDLRYDRLQPPELFSTNEFNFSLLDGSMSEMPDNLSGYTWGVFGEGMSCQYGVYTTHTKVKQSFQDPHKSKGITLYYYSDCGYTVRVTWYSDTAGSIVIKSGEYETTSNVGVVRESVSGFRCITVEFLASSIPYRFVKWWSIDFGITRIVTDEEIDIISILEEIDPTSEGISANIMRGIIRSKNSFVSPTTSPDFDDMFMEHQMLTIERSDKPFGVFFLETWEDPYQSGIQFEITAACAISILELYPHMGGMYQNEPVINLLNDIFNKCFSTGLVTYSIDPVYQDSTVTGWIPIGNCAYALQHIAFALNATVNAARSGDIRIYPREVESKSTSYPESNDKQPWVNMDDLKSYIRPKYISTNEPNYPLLDNDIDEFPDVTDNLIIGWISESMSDENGMFSEPYPHINIPFETSRNLRELILYFGSYSEEYMSLVRVTFFNEYNNVLHTQDYEFHENPGILTDRIYGYRRILFEVMQTSAPFRFAKIASINYGRSFYIPLEKQYRRGRDKPTDYISGVRVTSHSFVPGNDDMQIFDDIQAQGISDPIEFPEPLHSVVASGGNIIDRGANYVIVNMPVEGRLILTGKRYINNKRIHAIDAETEAGRVEKLKHYKNYTLIAPSIADERARELFEHLRLPIKSEVDIQFDDTEVGLVSQLQTMGNDVVGVVQTLDIKNLRANIADIKVVGNVMKR